ncbi:MULTISPECIES: hypothetical protein [Curtobacterium]|jgi:hypothetical protein|uniref:hypothetical protein n=1 Tax=Curtobacterium TaxID=2034 RepID=UPI000488C1AB|nr:MULTISPECIES: hypothetical protein [Curtobacterium]MBT1583952.1 hypothetical protein [Curtobacterium flaccumfaciens pv. flaccumfaciens]MBT1605996.1 hypothetical protein [Curtobacterium flaccumfaciens pv. betae]MBT1632345.1 hypothetical protein [Curtobacterium flaccumfaciens pv. oortii]MBT1656501.1 hypothetical protein [Curtobacterium flaccumfaciens pv. betae]MCS0470676.1 hypothetical protein [Curtobacterium flaccumfaciens pv. betae]
MPKKLIALATAGLALTLLAGCSGGDSGSSSAPSASKTAAAAPAQTKGEACSLLENELASFLKEQGSSSAPADPKARAALVDEFVQRIDSALTKVSNDQVHDTFEDFSGAAKGYSSAIRSGAAEDSAEVKKAQTEVQTTLDQVSAVCPAKS